VFGWVFQCFLDLLLHHGFNFLAASNITKQTLFLHETLPDVYTKLNSQPHLRGTGSILVYLLITHKLRHLATASSGDDEQTFNQSDAHEILELCDAENFDSDVVVLADYLLDEKIITQEFRETIRQEHVNAILLRMEEILAKDYEDDERGLGHKELPGSVPA